jgi:nitronate monooxygenase
MFQKISKIIQAPMAGVQDHRLAVAVSNHGGLGSLPFGMLSPKLMSNELTAYRQLSKFPVNVNFFCHEMPQLNEEKQNNWEKKLQSYAESVGLSEPGAKSVLRMPFDDQAMQIVEEFLPEVVSFHFGLPEDKYVERIKQLGLKIISSATTLDEALFLQSRGVDAVIAQGVEAGGHRAIFLNQDLNCQVGAFTLLSQLIKRLRIPIIAAGGIASQREIEWAFSLGASAVQIGSAWLLCDEATTSQVHRKAIVDAQNAILNDSQDLPYTAITNVFSGRPARGLMNRFMKELGPLSYDAPDFPYASAASAALRTAYEGRGEPDFSPLWCGQNFVSIRTTSAADLMAEFKEALISK